MPDRVNEIGDASPNKQPLNDVSSLVGGIGYGPHCPLVFSDRLACPLTVSAESRPSRCVVAVCPLEYVDRDIL